VESKQIDGLSIPSGKRFADFQLTKITSHPDFDWSSTQMPAEPKNYFNDHSRNVGKASFITLSGNEENFMIRSILIQNKPNIQHSCISRLLLIYLFIIS
jgi:hypothetical protein